MQIASSVVFALLTLLPGQGSMTGTWRLDRTKSDFGGADAPRLFVLHLEQIGNRLAATMFTADVVSLAPARWESIQMSSDVLRCPEFGHVPAGRVAHNLQI